MYGALKVEGKVVLVKSEITAAVGVPLIVNVKELSEILLLFRVMVAVDAPAVNAISGL